MDCTDPVDCLEDEQLTKDQRHLLAVVLKWQRAHIQQLQNDHVTTDRRIEELSRALQEHLNEAAPALQLLKTHERTFQRVDTILRIAFCKTWQFVAAFLAGWLVDCRNRRTSGIDWMVKQTPIEPATAMNSTIH